MLSAWSSPRNSPPPGTSCASRLSQTANGEQDAFGLLASRAPILLKASGKSLFLLSGLELRHQERMPDADLLAIERIYDGLR